MAITFSCMRYIHTDFGFEIRFQLFANSSDTPVHKEQKSITTATNLGIKIAINAFL